MPLQVFARPAFGANSLGMDGDRIAKALARIEAASTRIEAAAGQRPPSDPHLQARYDKLRAETETAMIQVEAMIRSLEP